MSRSTYLKSIRQQTPINADGLTLKESVVAINRVTKVVKGGKNLSFSALVVVGDEKGMVGYGLGKAREVPMAIRKGIEVAKKNLIRVNLTETTIPHQVTGTYSASEVLIKPAPPGTGVIAGGPVRPVMEAVGINNVFTKSIGNNNPHNAIKATFDGLMKLKDKKLVAEMRGKEVQEL
jgi:small subunit ribosomal protein S5